MLVSGSRIARQYGVRAYPTSFWIDRSGKIVDMEVGFDPAAFGAMEKRIEELLAAGAKSSATD